MRLAGTVMVEAWTDNIVHDASVAVVGWHSYG